jgi:RNA polymerase primary sigma factor
MMDEEISGAEMSGNDRGEGGDAPLIDLNEASIKKLIARAKRRGVITYDELNEALPQDQMSSEQIEDIMAAISEMGVNIVENDDDATDPEDRKAEDAEDEEAVDDRPDLVKKKETVERTDDPVRMYLREMGAVELLSREGEIAIAKRIESGRDTMILGLCESPITFHAIIQWSEALNNGEMQLREILDLDAMLSKEPQPENLNEDGEDENDGEISDRPPALPTRKRKTFRRKNPPTRRMRTASSAAPAAPPRKRKRTTLFRSPRWKRSSSPKRLRSSR